jgi:hypothetical protein
MLSIKNSGIRNLFLIISLSVLFSSGIIQNPDTHLRLTQTRGLIERGSFEIPSGYGDLTHGNIAINKEGQQFSVYNPGQALLFLPIHILINNIGRESGGNYYTISFAVSFISYTIYGCLILSFFKLSKRIIGCHKVAYITTAIFAFTSYLFSHAQDSYEHIYETLFIFLSVSILHKKNITNKNLIHSAILIGIGTLFRTSTLFALIGLLFLIPHNKQRFVFLTTLIPFGIILLYYNFIRFGHPLENGYQIAWKIANNISDGDIWTPGLIPKHLFGLLFSFGKGLLLFSPSIILILLYGKQFFMSNKRLALGIYIITITYLLIYSTSFSWHGSAWCWGPRYITPIIPLLYLHILYFKKSHYKLIITVSGLSLAIQLFAVTIFYKRDLVKTHIKYGDIFWSDEYFFSPKFSPIIGQVKSFRDVIHSNSLFIPKKTFRPPGPWKDESRTTTNQVMLEHSTDLSTYNFWWYRTLQSAKYTWIKLLAFIIPITCLLISVINLSVIWKSKKASS